MAPGVKSRSKTSARKPPKRVTPLKAVLYLYAISRGKEFRVDAAGVDGSSTIESLPSSGMICWVSRVPRRDFADELNEHMQDLDWLAAAGVRHQQAVAAIAARTDVLPARFATVFLTAESLERHLREQKSALLAAFNRIGGCDEWGVKIQAVTRSQPASKRAAADRARTGREYLQRKAAMLHTPSLDAAAIFEDFANELSRHSREAVRIATQGSQAGLEWQASFLVPRQEREAFLNITSAYAERWRDRHRIECTGPWPPYSFVASLGAGANAGPQS
jgi:hypothetical protein